jgi:hypothetical protein
VPEPADVDALDDEFNVDALHDEDLGDGLNETESRMDGIAE